MADLLGPEPSLLAVVRVRCAAYASVAGRVYYPLGAIFLGAIFPA